MTGISEMFAELDGYDRYESELESALRRARSERRESMRNYERWYRKTIGRAYYRDYQTTRRRNRYQNDPAYREKWLAYLSSWRAAKRAASGKGPRKVAQHGDYSKYSGGCRCDACRAASAAYTRGLRARKRAA